eukprot:scaffold1536_cov397-Prasinococcus_capsulatus_cf.AAC.26
MRPSTSVPQTAPRPQANQWGCPLPKALRPRGTTGPHQGTHTLASHRSTLARRRMRLRSSRVASAAAATRPAARTPPGPECRPPAPAGRPALVDDAVRCTSRGSGGCWFAAALIFAAGVVDTTHPCHPGSED